MIWRHYAALLTTMMVEKRSTWAPGSDKVSKNTSSGCVFISLLDLLREDFLLVSDVRPWLPDLGIMSSKNA